MIKFYKTIDNKMTCVDELTAGCWVDVVSPTQDEIEYLINDLKLDNGFVRSALDEEESSRIEVEDDQTLIIIDSPIAQKDTANTIVYSTTPIGIIITGDNIVTLASHDVAVLTELEDGMIKNVQTQHKTRFLLTLLLRVATRFLQYLKQIDKIAGMMETSLHKSMQNKVLIQLLGLEKSLVYFSTSLKANEITLEKILRGRVIKLYEEDQDLLEDVLIEVKQAIDMSNIYSSTLSSTMDAFSSIISNNLNSVMKTLTSITVLLAIPTMISGFYGMNTDLPLPFFWFPMALSVGLTALVAFILIKTNMFK